MLSAPGSADHPDPVIEKRNRKIGRLVKVLEQSRNDDLSPRVPPCFEGRPTLITPQQRFVLNRELIFRGLGNHSPVLSSGFLLAFEDHDGPKLRNAESADQIKIMLGDDGAVLAMDQSSILGQGSLGIVFAGQDVHSGRFCTFKKCTSDREFDLLSRDRESQALSTMGKLVDSHEEFKILVTDYGWGCDYLDFLITQKPNFSETIDMFLALAIQLQDLHDNNIIHRDVKPENALWDGDTCTLIDLGFAVVVGDTDQYHCAKRPGTKTYLAPEVYHTLNLEFSTYSFATDIFALGATGAVLFSKMSPPKISFKERKKHETGIIGLPYIYRNLPIFSESSSLFEEQWLASLLARMIDLEPTNRPSLEEVISELHEIRKLIDVNETIRSRLPKPGSA